LSASNKTVGAILAAHPHVLARLVSVFLFPKWNIEATLAKYHDWFFREKYPQAHNNGKEATTQELVEIILNRAYCTNRNYLYLAPGAIPGASAGLQGRGHSIFGFEERPA
jgi:hypothetical protein